jgi:tRNA-splicing ligase RtcB
MADRDALLNLSETGWIDESLSRKLQNVADLRGRVAPVVCLPDIHLKPGTHVPTGLATALACDIIPDLASWSLNCGMGILRTDIQAADLTPARIRSVFRAFRDTARSTDWDLTHEQMIDTARCGFPAVSSKYGFDDCTARQIENGGCIGLNGKNGAESVLNGLPPPLLSPCRQQFGLDASGNHFVEFQKVGQMHDSRVASKWGLAKEQVVILYHGGGGPLGQLLGWCFGNLANDSLTFRQVAFSKVKYHFGNTARLRDLPRRLKYFRPRALWRQHADSDEGRRLQKAITASMNYGYAYRMAIAARAMHSLRQVFGAQGGTCLLRDSSHNSIQREILKGREVWIHRRGSCRVEPEVPIILRGTANSESLLAVGAESAHRFMRSAPSGLGQLASRNAREAAITPLPGHTLRFNGCEGEQEVLPRFHSARLLTAVERMEAEGLLRRVVDLVPVAVLNGSVAGSS